MEFSDNLLRRTRFRAGVIPAVPGSVIGAHTSKPRHARLNEREIRCPKSSAAVFQDDGGTTLAYTLDMQAMASNVDKSTESRISPLVYPARDGLVDRSAIISGFHDQTVYHPVRMLLTRRFILPTMSQQQCARWPRDRSALCSPSLPRLMRRRGRDACS